MRKISKFLLKYLENTSPIRENTADDNCIHIKLAAWREQDGEMVPNRSTEVIAKFGNAKILTLDTYEDDVNDIKLPWDIIGFDSDELLNGGWSFCLHTDCIEYCFESDWPEIEFVQKQ